VWVNEFGKAGIPSAKAFSLIVGPPQVIAGHVIAVKILNVSPLEFHESANRGVIAREAELVAGAKG
jgi:hypothetical protein